MADRSAAGRATLVAHAMISIPGGTRVLIATRPIDFRKGAHSLAALAAEMLGEDPFSGVVIVFRSKRADRLKILVWDTSGLVLIWKQLQQGTFRWPPIMDGTMKLSAAEFAALFDGLDWSRIQTIKPIHKPTVAA
jgi:transposase